MTEYEQYLLLTDDARHGSWGLFATRLEAEWGDVDRARLVDQCTNPDRVVRLMVDLARELGHERALPMAFESASRGHIAHAIAALRLRQEWVGTEAWVTRRRVIVALDDLAYSDLEGDELAEAAMALVWRYEGVAA